MLEEEPMTDPAEAIDATEAPASAKPPRKPRRRGLDRATVGVAVLIALGGAGLYYMHWRTLEGVALLGSADAKAANLTTLLAGGKESLTTLSKSIRSTRAIVDRIVVREDPALDTGKPMGHDPFEFASLEPRQPIAKPISTNIAAREQARAKALAAARLLQLQSIMYGTTRRSCLIDGKLYFEGQALGEFTIGRIATDAVSLQSGEFKFELRLRK